MTTPIYNISLPNTQPHTLDQNEAFFTLTENGKDLKLRFHDYDAIYSRPGLYEQLFYRRLHCTSPTKTQEVLQKVLKDNHRDIHELRVLDLGAGNGMVGELLDAARVVGIDITDEARKACNRDRPHAYDSYYVADLSRPDPKLISELSAWNLDCLTCVAALGYGDIPLEAFANAYNLIAPNGWVVFNIKENFLSEDDRSGFSVLVKNMMLRNTLHVHHLERYRHRISIDGRPLFYYILVGQKTHNIAENAISQILENEKR